MERHAQTPSSGPPELPAFDVANGVTFVEAMLVVAIVGILVAASLPGFGRLLAYNRVAAATNDFVHAITLARSEALRRNRRVYLAPVGAHWHDGWVVFVDRNDNRVYDATVDEVIHRHDALPGTIRLVNPANAQRESFTDVGSPQRTYVLFDGAGYARQRNGALLLGSMTVVDTGREPQTVRTICLAAYARVRIVADRIGCS